MLYFFTDYIQAFRAVDARKKGLISFEQLAHCLLAFTAEPNKKTHTPAKRMAGGRKSPVKRVLPMVARRPALIRLAKKGIIPHQLDGDGDWHCLYLDLLRSCDTDFEKVPFSKPSTSSNVTRAIECDDIPMSSEATTDYILQFLATRQEFTWAKLFGHQSGSPHFGTTTKERLRNFVCNCIIRVTDEQFAALLSRLPRTEDGRVDLQRWMMSLPREDSATQVDSEISPCKLGEAPLRLAQQLRACIGQQWRLLFTSCRSRSSNDRISIGEFIDVLRHELASMGEDDTTLLSTIQYGLLPLLRAHQLKLTKAKLQGLASKSFSSHSSKSSADSGISVGSMVGSAVSTCTSSQPSSQTEKTVASSIIGRVPLWTMLSATFNYVSLLRSEFHAHESSSDDHTNGAAREPLREMSQDQLAQLHRAGLIGTVNGQELTQEQLAQLLNLRNRVQLLWRELMRLCRTQYDAKRAGQLNGEQFAEALSLVLGWQPAALLSDDDGHLLNYVMRRFGGLNTINYSKFIKSILKS